MTNKTMKTVLSLGSALMASKAVRSAGRFEGDDMLGWIGLARRRSHFWENVALVGLGAVAGATGALLLAPASGTEMRCRISGQVKRVTKEANERITHAREQLGPIEERLVAGTTTHANTPLETRVPAARQG
jgi:hypothetical protein